MAAAQHKLSRPDLLAAGRRRHGTEFRDASDGFARLALAPRRPALRVSPRSSPLLRKAVLRLGALG